ncbi:MAG: hypothetical protein CMH54_09095 [Myxococcales bacterium]|nr:hypothetical protein [Myxococcales bacterium]
MSKPIYLFLVFLWFWPLSAQAFDAFNDSRVPANFVVRGADGLRLGLKGIAELSWRDIEGRGGVGHDSLTDTVTLGTRSGHANVDGLRLAFRVETPEDLAFYSAFAFDEYGSRAEGAWFDHRVRLGPGMGLHTEIGLHTPFVAVDDKTSRPPIAARIYWGSPEMHICSVLSGGGVLNWWAGVSMAMMRPLDAAPINDASERQGTVAVLSYGPATTFSGNQPVFGGRAGLQMGGFSLEGFGYGGKLSALRGTDELRNRLAHFALLPGYNSADPRSQDRTFWWAGARMELNLGGVEARLEWLESQESLLRRHTAYAQLGYVWALRPNERWLRTLELRVRVERYQIRSASDPLTPEASLRVVDPSQALTWDYQLATVALSTRLYRDLLHAHLETSFIKERNGAPLLGIADQPIDNNETTIQLELRF